MKTGNHISVRIFTGLQGEHFAVPAAVAVGSMTEGFQPFAPQMVVESEVWILQHRRNDTLYAKFSTDYLATDGKKAQVLICLFLPAGKKLAGGKSPFGLLNDLQGLLLIYGVRGGRLIPEQIKPQAFEELVEQQRLSSLAMPLPVMNGKEPAAYRANNDVAIDKLMRRSHFPALSMVAWLEIGRRCTATIDLTQRVINPQPLDDPNANMGPAMGPAAQSSYLGGVPLGDDEHVVVVDNNKKKPKYLLYVGIAVACLLALMLIGSLSEKDDDGIDGLSDSEWVDDGSLSEEALPAAEETEQQEVGTEDEVVDQAAEEAAEAAAMLLEERERAEKNKEEEPDRNKELGDKSQSEAAIGAFGVKNNKEDTEVLRVKDVVRKEEPKIEDNNKEIENNIFEFVEQQASFPGGPAAKNQWLAQNIRYPADAQKNNIQGRVTVQFVVELNGSISNVVVVRGVAPSLDNEAVRVVKSMPKWTPGKQNGRPVRSKFTLPINFRL